MIEQLAGGNIWLMIAIKFGIMLAIFLPAISVIAMFSIWWERKVAGHIQSRVGPMHVGLWHGWAQSLADGIKLILKEDLVPQKADRFLFRFAPYMAFAPVFAAFIAMPFGPQFVFEAGLNIGVLYILAVLSVEVMSTIMAGWGSNSKWSIYGAMREACQMVSYEIPLGISIIIGVLVAGTLNLVELGHLQAGGMFDWFVFHNPFIFCAFLVYFVASLAANKRAPFDLPESESELVAGYLTEYSGLRWSLFFLAEYNAMFIVGGIQAALFLGGWNSPLGTIDPVYNILGYDPVAAGQAYFSGALSDASSFNTKADAINASGEGGGLTGIGLFIVNCYGVFWFATKAMIVIWLQMWLRWTLPRIRIDQVLYTCVKVLLPASIILLIGTASWIAVVPQPDAGLITGTNKNVQLIFERPEIAAAPASNDKKQADTKVPVKLDFEAVIDQAAKGSKTKLFKVTSITKGRLYRMEVGESEDGKPTSTPVLVKIGEGLSNEDTFTFQFDKLESASTSKEKPASENEEEAIHAVTLVAAKVVTRAGHLTENTPWFQGSVQVVLGLIFIGINFVCIAVMAGGWFGILFKGGEGQPPKSLFPDVMPVGKEVAFTKYAVEEVTEEEAS
jgi:NADH-quinone oxidoreductase subunit H